MKILIETTTLVSASIFFPHTYRRGVEVVVEHKYYRKCRALFNYIKKMGIKEAIIISKTVADNAKFVLFGAVANTIKTMRFPNIVSKHRVMDIQHLIHYDALDKLDYYLEECSTIFETKKIKVNLLVRREIRPYLKEITLGAVRYIYEPWVPRMIKRRSLRQELKRKMVESLPAKGVIYPGMPRPIELKIMAEATILHREYKGDESIYIASCDNHFKPNPIRIGSHESTHMQFTGELDSTIRDKLADKFGFIGEDPEEILLLLKEKFP